LTLQGKSRTLPADEKSDEPHSRHYYYPTLNWWVGLQVIDRELLKPAIQAGFFVKALRFRQCPAFQEGFRDGFQDGEKQ
jgi:hypothetical protein